MNENDCDFDEITPKVRFEQEKMKILNLFDKENKNFRQEKAKSAMN